MARKPAKRKRKKNKNTIKRKHKVRKAKKRVQGLLKKKWRNKQKIRLKKMARG